MATGGERVGVVEPNLKKKGKKKGLVRKGGFFCFLSFKSVIRNLGSLLMIDQSCFSTLYFLERLHHVSRVGGEDHGNELRSPPDPYPVSFLLVSHLVRFPF